MRAQSTSPEGRVGRVGYGIDFALGEDIWVLLVCIEGACLAYFFPNRAFKSRPPSTATTSPIATIGKYVLICSPTNSPSR